MLQTIVNCGEIKLRLFYNGTLESGDGYIASDDVPYVWYTQGPQLDRVCGTPTDSVPETLSVCQTVSGVPDTIVTSE